MSLEKYLHYKQYCYHFIKFPGTITGYCVHFAGATEKHVPHSEKKSQPQPSPAQESLIENQIIPHISPDITDDLRVLGKYSKL